MKQIRSEHNLSRCSRVIYEMNSRIVLLPGFLGLARDTVHTANCQRQFYVALSQTIQHKNVAKQVYNAHNSRLFETIKHAVDVIADASNSPASKQATYSKQNLIFRYNSVSPALLTSSSSSSSNLAAPPAGQRAAMSWPISLANVTSVVVMSCVR